MLPERTPGRSPTTIIEMDQDRCGESYGVAPCAAALGVTGTFKCFNTMISCQDPLHYNRQVRTLRFCTPAADLPRDVNMFPSIVSVSTSPTEINIGGGDRNMGPLGRRASITIMLADHPYHDRLVDKYWRERDYDPMTRGTFWTKWLARNPFYSGRSIRVREGYIGQAIADMPVRHYVMDRIELLSEGRVRIVAKDPLKLTDADRATAPFPSTGTLSANVTDVATVFALLPAGIGNAEYPASGIASIGSETFSFTRVGDNVTFVTRGLRGTEQSSHNAGDVVQLALVITSMRVEAIKRMLLVTYAGIPEDFINYANWQAEAERWLSGFIFSTVITQPTGVGQLLGELADHSGSFIWWRERTQEVGFRAMRPFLRALGDPITDIDGDANIIEDSMSQEDKPDERISQVWLYYNQINPTEGVEDKRNFSRLRVRKAIDAETANQYGERRIIEIFSRWLGVGNDAQALTVSNRKLERYRDNPTVYTFRLDAKDRALDAGDVVDLAHPDIVDVTGAPARKRVHVVACEDVEAGHSVEYKCRPYGFTGRYAFITPNGVPHYSNATLAQRQAAAFMSDGGAPFSDGTEAYRII